MRELKGTHDGQGLRVGIVAARFNEVITARLLRGALTALYDNSVRLNDIDVARVPGSFEVPTVARAMARLVNTMPSYAWGPSSGARRTTTPISRARRREALPALLPRPAFP